MRMRLIRISCLGTLIAYDSAVIFCHVKKKALQLQGFFVRKYIRVFSYYQINQMAESKDQAIKRGEKYRWCEPAR